LIADDMEQLRVLLTRVIERDGRFEVVGHAHDGEQAVSLTLELAPDIVILDLMMPKKSGMEALAEIREASPSTKVVFFTGATIELPHPSAADGLLEKGATPKEILAAIESALEG
jgi:DNA-binding NarL/FixJ family response regulator